MQHALLPMSLTLGLFLATVGQASKPTDSDLCDLAAQQAARTHAVPLEILRAIALVETGRNQSGQTRPWPWAINQDGQGHWFDDAAAAAQFAKDSLAAGDENFDLGCFQINQRWHGDSFTSVDAALDPQTNADFAAGFLFELLQSQGSWAGAVAAYHSRSPDEAEKYLIRVEAALTTLRSEGAGSLPTDAGHTVSADAGPRNNRFPLLKPGARGSGASLMPMVEGAGPLFVAVP